MFAAIFVSAAGPGAPAAPAPAASAAAASPQPGGRAIEFSKPLREVVFRVSYSRRQELSIGHYGAVPPDAAVAQTGDKGTITVDVMAIGPNGLGLQVSENWNSHRYPAVYRGTVTNDGSVYFRDQPISQAALALLPFFAPRFTGDQALDEGSHWIAKENDAIANIEVSFAVKNVDGPIVTLSESQVAHPKAPQGMDLSSDGTIRYKPSLLVPISGALSFREARMGVDTTNVILTNLNFERASDTRDPG